MERLARAGTMHHACGPRAKMVFAFGHFTAAKFDLSDGTSLPTFLPSEGQKRALESKGDTTSHMLERMSVNPAMAPKKARTGPSKEDWEDVITHHMRTAGWPVRPGAPLPSVIVFYSRSALGRIPFTPYEHVAPGDSFDALYAKFPDFRRMLSNFHEPRDGLPFQWRGRSYWTVEHAWHASKFRYPGADAATKAHAVTFEVDSGSAWASDPAAAKRAGGKGGSLKARARMFDDWPRQSGELTGDIQVAFYRAHAAERDMLRLTAPAFLLHLVSRKPASAYVPWTAVMTYRDTELVPHTQLGGG